MTYELRPITEADQPAWHACLATAFGHHLPEPAADWLLGSIGLERTLAAFDGHELVGTAGWFPVEMTFPGDVPVPTAAVVAVSVLPSHRRRGILRKMMHRQLVELRRAGFAFALLTASEGGIYRRFGYGRATRCCNYELDKRVARMARPVAAPGSVHVVTPAQAEEMAPPVWEAARLAHCGEVSLAEGFWQDHFHEAGIRTFEASKRFFACYEHGGVIEGLVDYQVVEDRGPAPQRIVDVELLVTVTADAYEALTAYLLGLDLTDVLRMQHRPVDEPLRHLLSDARQLRMTRFGEDVWVRPLDPAALMTARRYRPASPTCRFLLRDELFPDNDGVYTVAVDREGRASVEHHVAGDAPAADVEVDAAALGSVVLGGERLTSLVRAGRAAELVAGGAWAADVLFLTDREPFATVSP